MNQPSPAATEASVETATPSGVMPSLEERIASVNESLEEGIEREPEADAEAAAASEEPAAAAEEPAEDAAAAQRAAERRARLDAMAAKARDAVDRKASLAAADKMTRELAELKARAEAAEAAVAKRIDASALDEAGFFALAEQSNIPPEKFAAWMQKAITSPEKVAEAAALQATQRTYDPKLAAYEARLAKQDEQIAALIAQQEAVTARNEEHRQTQAFLGMVQQNADRAPLAARLLAADQNEFLQMAEIAAGRVPGMGPDALLDAVEELLDGDTRKAAQVYAALYGPPSQTSAPTTPTTRGAAKPNTVSNSLAQERASLEDEEDFARLPIEERAARLIRSR